MNKNWKYWDQNRYSINYVWNKLNPKFKIRLTKIIFKPKVYKKRMEYNTYWILLPWSVDF